MSATPLSAACELADVERRAALERLQAGQWFAALRRLQLADASCPERAGQSAAQVKSTTEQLAAGLGVDPWLLLERAHARRLGGELDEARLLEDQAAFSLEAASGAELLPSVPVESDPRIEAFWSVDSEWLLERSGQGLSLRRRGDWYPRLHVPGFAAKTNDRAYASPDLGALLVTDSTWVEDQDDETAKGYWLTLVDVSASKRFGSVRARFEIAAAQAIFSPDGRVFAFPEATPDNRSRAPSSYFSWASTETGQLEHRIEAPGAAGSVQTFRFDPQSQRALVQWTNGFVSIVDLASGQVSHQPGLSPDQRLHHDPISPDGRFAVWPLAKGRGRREFMLFDLTKTSGRRISAEVCNTELGLSFDSGSQVLNLGGNAGATCDLELTSGRLVRRLEAPDSPQYRRPYVFAVPQGGLVEPSPDGRFFALNVRYGSQFFAADATVLLDASPMARAQPHLVPLGSAGFALVNDARQWQWSPESGRAPLPPEPNDACSLARRLGPGRRVAWYEHVDYDYTQQGLVDCKTGERTRLLESHAASFALVDDARLIAADPDRNEAGLVYDLKSQRVIGRFSFPGSSAPTNYALTGDDRYLASESAIWDLARGELVAKLPPSVRNVAAFGKRALLTERPGLITIHRAPEFALSGVLVLADDGSSAAVFGYGPGGRVNAVEVLGPEQAWDTTFTCSVGATGVPFRICRETLEQPGLLRALLE